MRYLSIVVQRSLKIGLINGPIVFPIELNDTLFTEHQLRDDIVFYDWFVNPIGNICALEIHLSPHDSRFQTSFPLSESPSIDLDAFVRIWFSDKRDGIAQGLEAFDDIYFAHSMDGQLAIIVGIDTWLNPAQAQQLVSPYCTTR